MSAVRRRCLAIVLAAGEGTRMRSRLPKVLHEVAGRSMLARVLDSLAQSGADAIALVVGPGRDDVAAAARLVAPEIEIFEQTERRGTAHAVLAARAAIERGFDDVLIAFADTPLLETSSFGALRDALAGAAAVGVLGFHAANPTGYGRLILDGAGRLTAIREHKDASEAERATNLCNAGVMALAGAHALELLEAVTPANVKNEFYLTDVVADAFSRGLSTQYRLARESEVIGVNDRAQLAAAENVAQQLLRARALSGGATLIAPETVFFSYDTEIGEDVTIEPHVVFGPGVKIGAGAKIHAFSHLAGAEIGPDCAIGPFARLRPGARLAGGVKVGNFVELKTADVGAGAKINHLSYIGDADIGEGANIGAGTITCNYDGFHKFRTEIGAGAFVGSNSALVAPVAVGAGAYIGSGSVVTFDVAPDALAVARGRQVVKPGWAAEFRENKAKPPYKKP